MKTAEHSVELKRHAAALGFAATGISRLDRNPHAAELDRWLAGLGWIGKNMMLIHPEIGSFTFIGVILTDADLEPDLPFEADRCGTCRRCLDACPTQAFVGPRDLDARACISYLTIEHRGEFTKTQGEQVGDWLFGCDVCQDVCPWNVSFARATHDPELAPRPEVARPDLQALAHMDDSDFQRRFAATPFTRPGHRGMRRNATAVLDA